MPLFSRMHFFLNKEKCPQMPMYKGFLDKNKPLYFSYFKMFAQSSRFRSKNPFFTKSEEKKLDLTNFNI